MKKVKTIRLDKDGGFKLKELKDLLDINKVAYFKLAEYPGPMFVLTGYTKDHKQVKAYAKKNKNPTR